MHQLITMVGSLLIMALFICQFSANETTFLRVVQIEEIIGESLENEISLQDEEKEIRELIDNLSKLPYTKVKRNGDNLTVEIEGVIGVDGLVSDEENHITLKRKLKFEHEESVEDEKDEESDNNNGDADSDGNAQ